MENTCTSYAVMRRNRFVVSFPTSFNIPNWRVRSCTLPTVTENGVITVHIINPIICDNYDGDEKISEVRKNPEPYFDMKIELLDETGNCIGFYELKDCIITNIDNTVLNYDDHEILEGIIKIKYKDCETDKVIKIKEIYTV